MFCPFTRTPNVAGSTTGTLALPALALQTDNTWVLKIIPTRQETLTVKLLVNGMTAQTLSATVVGQSPTFLDIPGSLQQASLTSQAAAVTAIVANTSNPVVFVGEDSFLSIPVVDKTGTL